MPDLGLTKKADILESVCFGDDKLTFCTTGELLQFKVLAGTATADEQTEWDEIVDELEAREIELGTDATWIFDAEIPIEGLWDLHTTLDWWCAGIE